MRALAIDLGKVRVGIAIADELGLMAHPRPYLDGRNRRTLLESLAALAAEEAVKIFLVGLPRELRGREGPPARRARKFAEELGARTGLPVELVDEWLSTREARARLAEGGMGEREARTRIDSASAAVLLQSWLDGRPGRQGLPRP
jgi:putative Holliday junction resolvase